MAFCTYLDVQRELGTSLGTVTNDEITDMIADSESDDIIPRLRRKGIASLPASDADLKKASVQFTIAKIKRRQAHELSRANSTGLNDGTSFSTNPEAEAAEADRKAEEAIDRYVAYAGGSGVRIIRNYRRPF